MDEYYDEYDADLKKTIKDSMKELFQESQQEQTRQLAEARQKEGNEIVEAACKEAGITLDDFNNFIQTKEAFQDQVRQVASRAAKAKGRKPQPQQPQQGDDFLKPSQATPVNRRLEDGRSFQEKWKKGESRTGTDSEVLDMLTDMIGGDDTFKTSHQLKYGKK